MGKKKEIAKGLWGGFQKVAKKYGITEEQEIAMEKKREELRQQKKKKKKQPEEKAFDISEVI